LEDIPVAKIDVRYPVGPLPRLSEPLDADTRAKHIALLEAAPTQIRELVEYLPAEKLNWRYRQGGWTVRQLVHHVADSHMNAYVRMKLAATEDMPMVKTYEEALWAELPDAKEGDITLSLGLIDALHGRWVAFLRTLSDQDLRRSFKHPTWNSVTIEESIAMYSWHCRHHTAHIAMALSHRDSAAKRGE
jgi:uncharacterized damage-inducible protein DinB